MRITRHGAGLGDLVDLGDGTSLDTTDNSIVPNGVSQNESIVYAPPAVAQPNTAGTPVSAPSAPGIPINWGNVLTQGIVSAGQVAIANSSATNIAARGAATFYNPYGLNTPVANTTAYSYNSAGQPLNAFGQVINGPQVSGAFSASVPKSGFTMLLLGLLGAGLFIYMRK